MRRPRPLTSLALALGLGGAAAANIAAPAATSIDTTQPSLRKLFITDEHIQEMHNLRRTLNQPTKCPGNPVLRPERPWETAFVHNYGTMLFDEEQQRCFLSPWVMVVGPRAELDERAEKFREEMAARQREREAAHARARAAAEARRATEATLRKQVEDLTKLVLDLSSRIHELEKRIGELEKKQK